MKYKTSVLSNIGRIVKFAGLVFNKDRLSFLPRPNLHNFIEQEGIKQIKLGIITQHHVYQIIAFCILFCVGITLICAELLFGNPENEINFIVQHITYFINNNLNLSDVIQSIIQNQNSYVSLFIRVSHTQNTLVFCLNFFLCVCWLDVLQLTVQGIDYKIDSLSSFRNIEYTTFQTNSVKLVYSIQSQQMLINQSNFWLMISMSIFLVFISIYSTNQINKLITDPLSIVMDKVFKATQNVCFLADSIV